MKIVRSTERNFLDQPTPMVKHVLSAIGRCNIVVPTSLMAEWCNSCKTDKEGFHKRDYRWRQKLGYGRMFGYLQNRKKGCLFYLFFLGKKERLLEHR